MDHIPALSLFHDRSLTGSGFYSSSPGESPPAPFLDARGPSVTFAPMVSVCKGHMPPLEIPTSRMVSSLPLVPPATPIQELPPAEPPPVIPVPVPPPAEPPPPVLLPLLDFSLSCPSINRKGLYCTGGCMMARCHPIIPLRISHMVGTQWHRSSFQTLPGVPAPVVVCIESSPAPGCSVFWAVVDHMHELT